MNTLFLVIAYNMHTNKRAKFLLTALMKEHAEQRVNDELPTDWRIELTEPVCTTHNLVFKEF